MMALLFRPQAKQAGRGLLQQFLVSVFSPLYAGYSFFVPPPSQTLPSFVLVKGPAHCEASELPGCLGHLLSMCQGRHQAKQTGEQRPTRPSLLSASRRSGRADYLSALPFLKDSHSVPCY